MKTTEAIQILVDHFSGQTKTAKALGISQPTVNGWVHGVHGVSAKLAVRIESVTDGVVKAVDVCPDLRPLGKNAS